MVAFEGTLNSGSKIKVIAYIKSDNTLQPTVVILDDETYHCNLHHEEIQLLADTLSRACSKTAEQMKTAFEQIAAVLNQYADVLDGMLPAEKERPNDKWLTRYDGPRVESQKSDVARKLRNINNLVVVWKPNRKYEYG